MATRDLRAPGLAIIARGIGRGQWGGIPAYTLEPRDERASGSPTLSPYWLMELATLEKTLLELEPISRIVPTTITRITASITAYSAMSWPSSCDQSLPRKSFIAYPPGRVFDVPRQLTACPLKAQRTMAPSRVSG